MRIFLFVLMLCPALSGYSQPDRWQQRVKYTMDVDVDAAANTFKGKQTLEYANNSPDTLFEIFYHLYWNAFQPNSMMDARSQHLGEIRINGRPDWDARVKDRIAHLSDSEIGFQKVTSLKLNGVSQKTDVQGTIMQVHLTKPILPHSKVVLQMEFNSQVPVQIRRSGRDAANGVRFSMSQWYPKLCEYDREGWHPTPYVAREFYGVWGDYDVKISIDKSYMLGGTGYLQNAQQIGFGYEKPGTKAATPAGEKLTWHFFAPNVHDFVWAADPQFKHLVKQIPNGPTINVLYHTGSDAEWQDVADVAAIIYPYMSKTFGPYAYKQYSFIQGGDGGMEYPMACLINGPGLGTVMHEWMHSWYQSMLGTNESMYPWMDEGFATWGDHKLSAYYRDVVIRKQNADQPANLQKMDSMDNLLPKNFHDVYENYYFIAKSAYEEPLTTHADHYETNAAYGIAAYSKGCIFLTQLGYITGEQTLDKIMLEYYREWKFKHPDANDFVRVAEKVSGLQLDWYKEYWVNTTKTINYGIDSLWEEGGKTKIRLRNLGKMPMPIDVLLTFKDGTRQMAYIPMYLMFGQKPAEDSIPRTTFAAWEWTHPTYTFEIDKRINTLKTLEIDPSQRMADMERRNNKLDIPW